MSETVLTVIVPNYNTGEYTRRCLQSLFEHSPGTAGFLRVVVVDNGSGSFDCAALKSEFPGVDVVLSGTNLGFGGACNLGASRSRSRYLYFLNNDTVLLNDVTGILAGFLERHPDVGVCGAQQFDGDLHPVRSTRRLPRILGRPSAKLPGKPRPEGMAENAVEAESLSGANLFMRAGLFRDVGGFDRNIFLYHEEDDLALRVRRRGLRLAIVPGARLQHFHGKSSPAKLWVYMEDALSLFYYYEKHAGRAIAWLARLRTAGDYTLRWLKHGIRGAAGRDVRGLSGVYARLVVWALSGFPEEAATVNRQTRRAPGSAGTDFGDGAR